jgi:ubiquinone/menaquinone biosynthesis C-methylase UbiE
MANDKSTLLSEEALQRSYYAQTASDYDGMHLSANDEHTFALAILVTLIKLYGFESVADVGSGTGRALLGLRDQCPGLRCVGVEPVEELRKIGYAKGLSEEMLIAGVGDDLPFGDNEFDVVCEFGVLHHVPKSRLVLKEMCRVARKMVVISDSNVFAQGSVVLRWVKRLLYSLQLWPAAKWLQTGGKGYSILAGDGLQYSYSVFQDIKYLRRFWKKVYVIPTKGGSGNDGAALMSASHLMIVCSEKI